MISQSTYIKWWRLLRAPFILPPTTAKCHKCEWEKIDLDLLGCKLCANVHKCEYGKCKHLIETSDGLVCELSGVVVYTKSFVETEYMDTISISGTEVQDLQQATASSVEQIVTILLCSHKNKNVKQTSMTALLCKIAINCDKKKRTEHNIMHLCMQMLTSFNNMPYMFAFVSPERRKAIILSVVENCCQVFHVLVKHGMSIRTNEVQRLAVGIVYLMRYGVFMNNNVILQRIPELEQLLPPESTLQESYGIHPKYITEMENRLKFCLRHSV